MHNAKQHHLVLSHDMLIGIPAIDEQHALLFKLANRLLDDPGARANNELVVNILTDLGRFLILHLQTEEKYLRDLGLPADELEKHVHAHNLILEQYAELNLAATRGKFNTAADIFELVKQWVGDHLLETDMGIKAYLPTDD